MLLNHLEKESITQRVEKVVSVLMEEDPSFREELNPLEITQHIVSIIEKVLTIQQFNDMSEQELKENCSFVMVTEIFSKIGQEFTPEQMEIFDEAIKRK